MTAISSKKAEKQLEREIARKKRKLQKTTAFDVFNIIFLLILAFIVIVPFYYTIVRSFLTQQEFIMNGTTLWPQSPTIGNYRDIFVGTGLLRSFFNSVLYTVTGTLFSMFLATTLAYCVVSAADGGGQTSLDTQSRLSYQSVDHQASTRLQRFGAGKGQVDLPPVRGKPGSVPVCVRPGARGEYLEELHPVREKGQKYAVSERLSVGNSDILLSD